MDVQRTQKDVVPGQPSGSLPVHIVFGEIARRHPLKPALLHRSGSVSYGELAAAAGRIAAHLAAMAIGPGALVAICGESSPAIIAAILGILKVGAAYVPLDPSYPANALTFIRQDSAPAAMLLTRRQSEQPIARDFGPSLVIEHLLEGPAPAEPIADAALTPDALAYVMYTSGSTGRPKGVMVPHRAITRLVLDTDYASFGEDEVFLQQAPLAFDASTFEIWGALLNGAALALPDGGRRSLDDIAEAIKLFNVTTLWLTAGLFHLMVDHRLVALAPLRQLLAGGDVLSATRVRKLREALPFCRLINGYGPTENTTFSCCYTVPDDFNVFGDNVPIGTPINGTIVHVLDEAGRRVADGEPGELHVGGAGLALGYLNRPDLTAEKFVPSPFGEGGLLYRTGDQVRRRPDGMLEFLGRFDRQVKISGKRIELDEIEATARRSAMVGEVAVAVSEGPKDLRQILLVATPRPGEPGDPAALRRFLAEELPDYMRPARVEIVPELPLTPNGKLDRSKLATLVGSPAPASTAAGGIARLIYEIWREALGRDGFGVEDNFFDLGGSSLQLVGIHAALQAALGRRLPLVELFAYPTIRSLVQWLEARPTARPVSNTPEHMAAKRNAALARTRLARGMVLS